MRNRENRSRSVPVMRRLNRWVRTEILVALALIIAVLVSWWMMDRRELEAEMSSLLSVYGEQMEARFSGMDRTMGLLLEQEEDLALMGDESETERQHAMIRLKKTLRSILRIDPSAEWGVMASSAQENVIQAGENPPSVGQKERMGGSALRAAAAADGLSAGWTETELAGEIFYRRSALRPGQAVQLYVRRETLLRQIRIQEVSGIRWSVQTAGEAETETPGGFGALRLERPLTGTPFRLVCAVNFMTAAGRLRAEIAVLLCVTALLLAFTLYLRGAVRRSLIRPMAQLETDMRKIQAGDYERRITTRSDAREFQQMTGTLNQLLEEVLRLRIRELERQLALQEANQKYIRLQLRPHFFLNAMTTVSALSAKGKNQEIQTYIDALSRNIRYMFSAGMHTVPVREEILHVQNYLKMQELKYPDCVFSYVELPEELGDWPIPQMIIHTVVENEYKYAVSRDQMLMLLIRVSLESWQGQDMLLIEIEDDGQGYPPEVMERINRPGGAAESDGTRVGLWSIKRMLELMYDRTGLLELANQSPHGAVARIRVPREAAHEVRTQDGDEALRLPGGEKPRDAERQSGPDQETEGEKA